MMKTVGTKELNEAYKKFNKLFRIDTRSFHDLLWQIIVNETFKGRVFCLHVVVEEDGNHLVVAFASGGYQKTGVYFNDVDYNKCCDIVEGINEAAFKLSIEDTNLIVSNSMSLIESE